MSWFGKRDRALDAFAEAIQPELAALRTPAAPAELRERILADRAAGGRVILPGGRDSSVSVHRYVIASVAVIAGVLLLPLYRSSREDARDAQAVASLSFFGGVAHAEQPAGAPRLPAAFPIHAERIHAGTLRYRRLFTDSAERVVKTVEGSLSVTADSAEGTPAWRVVKLERESGASGAAINAETVFVRRSNLGLLTRAVHVRPYRRWNGINIEQRAIGDSLSGRMTLDDVTGMRPIASRLRSAYAPFVSDALTPIYLAAVPLSATWQGSLTVLGWAVIPKDVLHPVELRVTGEERVRVPAGTFDCWRMTITYSGGVVDYWVRKSDGIAVRAVEANVPPGGKRTVTLVSETGM
jgi:hypothetical protein